MEILFSLRVKKFLKETFLLGLLIAVVVFAWVRALLFEVPFSLWEDSVNLSKTILMSWAIIATFRILWHLLITALAAWPAVRRGRSTAGLWIVIILLSAALYACHAQPAATGLITDGSTGLRTRYHGIRAAETKLVMNGEVLHHTDIPLGEKFRIINDGVEGLEVRNSRVSVGCSLLVLDTTGRTLLSEPDLFATIPTFHKDSARFLQCLINTGTPMEWDQEYTVKVVFWDKYGSGTIENAVQVRMIDEP